MLRLPLETLGARSAMLASRAMQATSVGCVATSLVLLQLVCCANAQELTEPAEPIPAPAVQPGDVPPNAILTEGDEFLGGVETICSVCPWPVFGMYVKGGPSFRLGDGFFKGDSQIGYQIAFGAREPFMPKDRKFFFDFGGSYLSTFGREDPKTVSGNLVVPSRPSPSDEIPLENFMDLELVEISRVSAQTAFGWYFDRKYETCNYRFASRFGGRLSHIRGHFDEILTEELKEEIRDLADNELFTFAKHRELVETDMAPGIFAGIEMALDRRVSRTARISFLVDAEFAHDWIHFKGYAKKGLPTASVLFGVNLSR